MLRAAHRYQFQKIQQSVCTVLQDRNLGPRDRLTLGIECDISSWQFPAFCELVYETIAPMDDAGSLRKVPASAQTKVLAARMAIVRRRTSMLKTGRGGWGKQHDDFLCAKHMLDLWDEALLCEEPSVSLKRLGQTLKGARKCQQCSIVGNSVFLSLFSFDDENKLLVDLWKRSM